MKRILSSLRGNLPFFLFLLFSLLNLYLLLQVLGSLDPVFLDQYFNSDSLYLPSIYKDLFEDRSGLPGWHLNPAPNFFPEWPLFFLLRFLSGDFRIAAMAYTIVQFSLFICLISWIFKTVFNKLSWYHLILINLSVSMMLMIFFSRQDLYVACMFLTGYHNGAFLLALTSIGLTFSYFRHGNRWYLGLLFVTALLATLSDRLYVIMYTIPLFSMVLLLPQLDPRKYFMRATLAVLIAGTAGLIVFRLIQLSGIVHVPSLGWQVLNTENFTHSLNIFVRHMGSLVFGGGIRSLLAIITSLTFLAGFWFITRTGIRSIYFLTGKRDYKAPDLIRQFRFFSFAMIISIILNPLVNGNYVSPAIFRYIIYAFYYAVSFAVFLLLVRDQDRILPARMAGILAGIFMAALLVQMVRNERRTGTLSGISQLSNYCPVEVRAIDHMAGEYGLKYGISQYWKAKKTTMFSQAGVRVYAVHDNLHPWPHVTNRNWYYGHGRGRHGNPVFNFIIANNLDADRDIIRLFGSKIDTLYRDGLTVYKVPSFTFDPDRREPVLTE